MKFVDVVFNLALPRSFTYKVPEDLPESLSAGQRVLAPFGKRELTGIITRTADHSDITGCKEIIDVLEDVPLLQPEMLELTRWMAEYYLCAWGQAIQLALPRGLEQKSVRFINVLHFPEDKNLVLTERQQHLFDLIAGSSGKSSTAYRRQFGSGSFYHCLNELERLELIRIDQRLQHPPHPRQQIFVTIQKSIPEPDRALRTYPQLNQILELLKGQAVPLAEFREKTGLSLAVIKRLNRQAFLQIEKKAVKYGPAQFYPEEKKDIVLNDEQRRALNAIENGVSERKFKVFLLYGITGSGKTQVYLEAIKSCLAMGLTALVLIPEISLTPQTVQRFENLFPGRVVVFHSKMNMHERHETWMKVYRQEVPIVVGPRSALFMPLANLGIIIVDEEHDASYKQDNPAPRYHARDTAIYRARMNQAVVVLGSATPSLESYYNAQRGKYTLIELPRRINDVCLPPVSVVAMKGLAGGRRASGIFSPLLQEKIRQRLERREQIILLQNRRGHSAYLQCQECGYIFLCPNCAITLTYHAYHKNLLCHYCGYNKTAPGYCPKCNSEHIGYIGVGTQKIQAEILKLFPDARLIRMDLDTTLGKGKHHVFLKAFKEGRADILLGTQMIAKGLDFSRVTLVGVISADIGLSLPDYRAAERVFQLLTQVAGRAGRDELAGEVVVQSNLVTHYAIQYAGNHDYPGFYQQEIKYRRELAYPPYWRLVNLRYSSETLADTIAVAREITAKLRRSSKGWYEVSGPAPAPIARINKQFRWQSLVKINPAKDPAGIQSKRIIAEVLAPYLRTKESRLKIAVDVDPLEIL